MLWRDLDENREPEEYQLNRVVFGKNSAPMEAQFVAQENAPKYQHQYPLAAEAILKSTYMDDTLDSAPNEHDGIVLYRQLKDLWGKAGMEARKWVSNSQEVLAEIPEEDRAIEITINDGQTPTTKTLGMAWNSLKDEFKIPTSDTPRLQMTKRNVLPKVAAIFDPLGFISPFVVKAKILLQELWACGYEWDDEINDEIAIKIESCFRELKSLDIETIPRCLRANKVVRSKQIVTFVDAPKGAYGAAVYIRHDYEDSQVTCRLVASKAKVAPLTPMTIPRLELMGAVLGLRLTLSVILVLGIPMQDVTFYTDSMDVLWWIRGRGRDFRPFVANRIGEIQSHSDPCQWQHVSTHENPADLCTRGSSPSQLAVCLLWWEGPTWVSKNPEEWPKVKMEDSPKAMSELKPSKPENKSVIKSFATRSAVSLDSELEVSEWRLDPKRYSDWFWLVRVLARVRRFIHNIRNISKRQSSKELTVEEINEAESELICLAQHEAFAEEYNALKNCKAVSPKSQLIKLNPKLDDDDIIRLDGRLKFADQLPYNMRFPIILPRGHWITKLIVKHYHGKANHVAGVNFILNQLNERYWVVAAREEIREWEGQCHTCKRRRNKPASQIMAPLPKIRLRFTFREFDQCGVDYAGPFLTKQGRGKTRQKRWLCIFTCLATRAIHLEMAWSMDTDAFLNVFTRFCSRRGVPKEVTSDNGTNFVGAVNELKRLATYIDQERIKRKTAENGVCWLFNPPAAPRFGGAHEAMVKAAKRAIYAVLKNSEVKDEELITVFAGTEGLLNSRPITYQSSDARDITPLTPNHFLLGQMGGQFAPEMVETTVFHPRERWRKVQQLISLVWRRWLKEYIPMLNTRPKWTEIIKDLKDGDVVIVSQPNLSRRHWPLGRIVAVYPGKDGHTRVAKVQWAKKTIMRPIHKLVPFESSP